MEVNQRLYKILSAYVRSLNIEGCTEATLRHKRKENRLFLEFLEQQGHSMLAVDVSMFDVLAHLEDMKARGLAPASIQTRRRALHAWWNWMIEWDLAAENPVSKVRPPRVPRRRKPFLSEAEFHRLLELCPLSTLLGSRRASMLWLMATTGIRRRELNLLQVKDLDWEQGRILVMYGKGQKDRLAPFVKEAQRPLLRYLHNRKDSLPCLWVTENGRPLGYHGMGEDVTRLFRRAEIPLADAMHIFRRTFAANSVRQGVPRQYIRAVAGWTSPQMLDRYTAAMEEEEEAIDAFHGFKPFGA